MWEEAGVPGGNPNMSLDMRVRFTGDSKLPLGVNDSVHGCFSLSLIPAVGWRPAQGAPRLSPSVSWYWPPSPAAIKRISGIANG